MDPFSKWPVESAEWRKKLQMPKAFAPYSEGRQGVINLKGTKRVWDLLDCAAVQVCRSKKARLDNMKKALNDAIVDVSQSHGRRPVSNSQGVAHTLTTSSQLFSYRQERLLVPFEHLLLQGYPSNTKIPKELSDRDVRSLAGEAIALPSLGTICWALYLLRAFPQ